MAAQQSDIERIKTAFNHPALTRTLTDADANYILSIPKYKDDIYAAETYAYQLGALCTNTPEWNWAIPLSGEPGSEKIYVIRGFISKDDCIAELQTNNVVGQFIIRFSDTTPNFAVGFLPDNKIVSFGLISYDDGKFSITNDKFPTLSECIIDYPLTQSLSLKSSDGTLYKMPYTLEFAENFAKQQGGRRKYRMKRNNHAKKRTHRNKKRNHRKTKSRRRH